MKHFVDFFLLCKKIPVKLQQNTDNAMTKQSQPIISRVKPLTELSEQSGKVNFVGT